MNKKLQIVGLGRCIIGHLAKYLNTYESDKLSFRHHYLLNYTTCLNSSYSQEDISSIKSAICMPSIYDQIQCFEEIDKCDVCAIELFPPSGLYKHKSMNIFVCFESFTDQLASLGFESYFGNKYEFTKDSQEYLGAIEKLVTKIKSINKNIKIILVNGELTKNEDRPNIGSELIYDVINEVKKSQLLRDNFVKLVDINDLIDTLQEKRETFFEIAFPYIYIKHTRELKSIEIQRDCKHAISNIRTNFLKFFCSKIEEFGFSIPAIEVENKKNSTSGNNFTQRASAYLEQENKNDQIVPSFEDAKELSLFVSYAIKTHNQISCDIIKKFIKNLSLTYPSHGKDLKDYFYHIRTLAAFVYETKPNMLKELCQINMRILNLPISEIKPYTNFALLWITNIYLASLVLLDNADSQDIDEFINGFLKKLSENVYFNNYDEIKKIVSKGSNP